MPIIYAGSNDGVVTSTNAVSDTARNASTGTAVSSTGFTDNLGFYYSSGYIFERAYFRFDTRAISVTPASATLSIYFNSPVAGNFIVVKADSFGATLATSHFGNITNRPSTGTYSGIVTDYTSNFTPSATTRENITLNSNALTDIGTANSTVYMCLLNYDYDYLNGATNPSINATSNIVLNDFPGTDFDIYLDYVEGSAGRTPQAGGTPTRSELRDGYQVTTQLDVDTDYEFVLKNNLKSQVYFNIEGANGKDIFNTSSIRTTTSDSGSNVLGFVSESMHASFVLSPESTASFFMSSSTHTMIGNSFKVIATNPQVINPTSSIVYGVDLSIEA